MAGSIKIAIKLDATGIGGGSDDPASTSFTASQVPVEIAKGKPIVGSDAFSLDLGDIAAGSGFLLYLKALVGNFYFVLGSTDATPEATNSHLYIPEGEGYPIPINPDATAMAGIRGISDEETTGQLEYILYGSA